MLAWMSYITVVSLLLSLAARFGALGAGSTNSRRAGYGAPA
jgi:hypothetical protein